MKMISAEVTHGEGTPWVKLIIRIIVIKIIILLIMLILIMTRMIVIIINKLFRGEDWISQQ